ncbi:MAG: hypothetical protein HQM03_13065 [Magnetococcales bacterium]|nr:hypothetical protein [Magnetococcales bacterium]
MKRQGIPTPRAIAAPPPPAIGLGGTARADVPDPARLLPGSGASAR